MTVSTKPRAPHGWRDILESDLMTLALTGCGKTKQRETCPDDGLCSGCNSLLISMLTVAVFSPTPGVDLFVRRVLSRTEEPNDGE